MSDQDVIRLEEQVKTLFNDVCELKSDFKKLADQLANRLPVWATLLIGLLTGACGYLGAK